MVKLGIIGVGNMGSTHCKNILGGKCPEIEITAVADRRESRRQWAKETFDAANKIIEIFTEGEDLIKKGDVDAVLVAVPHYQHTVLSTLALKNEKHVMCEKPAGVYTKAVRELNELAKKSDKTFAMMFNQRTNPIFIKMKEIVSSGELGDIRRVNWIITTWYRTQYYYDSGSWRATWDGEGGGVLLNQCPHNLDLLQWICGMPSTVTAFAHEGKWHDIEVEDDVTAYLEYPNGATGVFITSTGDTPGTNRFEITMDGGKLVCDDSNKLTLYKLKNKISYDIVHNQQAFAKADYTEIPIPVEGKAPMHPGVLNAFAAHILRGEPLIADGCEGINGLTISNAMHLSSWLNKKIVLPIDEDLFLAELNKKRATSRHKETKEVTVDTAGSYGNK